MSSYRSTFSDRPESTSSSTASSSTITTLAVTDKPPSNSEASNSHPTSRASTPVDRSSTTATPPPTTQEPPQIDTQNKLQPLRPSQPPQAQSHPQLLAPQPVSQNVKPAFAAKPAFSAPPSRTTSPKPSRDTSPTRPVLRTKTLASSTASSRSRSRKNSSDYSPSRVGSGAAQTLSTIPSAATVQRALAKSTKPGLQSSSPNLSTAGSPVESPRHERSPAARSGNESPLQWPVSPRLRSPPPPLMTGAGRNMVSPRKLAQDRDGQEAPTQPNISHKRSTTPTVPEVLIETDDDETTPTRTNPAPTGVRSSRGTSGTGPSLETVRESSVPTTPALPLAGSKEAQFESGTERSNETSNPMEDSFSKNAKTTESGSDSGGKQNHREDQRKHSISSNSNRPNTLLPKRSYNTLNAGRGRGAGPDGSVRNMTVETEMVSAVPQVSLGAGVGDRGASGRQDLGGSIRSKASNETIRPKKKVNKPIRKATSLATTSSMADIFEAKVASAVDEADSSDSDETFVYESNPPDSQPMRQRQYHHSRTPSATSMASQAGDYISRNRAGLKDGNHSVAGKRSMKFTNNMYNINSDLESVGSGSGRGSRSTANGQPRHHHIGRFGRGGHAGLFDSESPFTPSQGGLKSPRHTSVSGLRGNSRPSSPRVPSYRTMNNQSRKHNNDGYGYDFDPEGADDERMPLVGSVRINRSRHGRRPNSASLRQLEYLDMNQGYFQQYGPCFFLTIALMVLVTVAVLFIMGLTQPLEDVHIVKLENVLASEQEIMLDLDVHAVNSNLFSIQVNDMDVNIFAKSRYVGTDQFWREHPGGRFDALDVEEISDEDLELFTTFHYSSSDGIDEGNDPISDPERDPQTMLLGRIKEFDSPLIFDASPIQHAPVSSVGEVRLSRPGNRTEEGGTARWERVIQHRFELIVRGVIKYQLPLSSRVRSSSINGRVTVLPDSGSDSGSDSSPDGLDGGIDEDEADDVVRANGGVLDMAQQKRGTWAKFVG